MRRPEGRQQTLGVSLSQVGRIWAEVSYFLLAIFQLNSGHFADHLLVVVLDHGRRWVLVGRSGWR